MTARPIDYDSAIRNIRFALASFITVSILFPSILQPFVSSIYGYLKTTPIYRASTFETFWTVLCYLIAEDHFVRILLQNPQWRFSVTDAGATQQSADTAQESFLKLNKDHNVLPARSSRATKPKGLRRPSRRVLEGIVYVAPLLVMDLTMIKKFADVPLEDKLVSGNYPASLASNSSHSGHFLLPSLHNFTPSSPLQTMRALPPSAPSSRRLILELVLSILIYDGVFFLFHLAMHLTPVVRRWHAPHHKFAEIHAQVTNHLSVFERLGLVLLANFSLNIIGAHVLTRTVFIPIFTRMLVEIHAGVDLPYGYEKILPHGWGGGARKHSRHHANGDGGFEPFFEWWDHLWNQYIRRKEEISQVQ